MAEENIEEIEWNALEIISSTSIFDISIIYEQDFHDMNISDTNFAMEENNSLKDSYSCVEESSFFQDVPSEDTVLMELDNSCKNLHKSAVLLPKVSKQKDKIIEHEQMSKSIRRSKRISKKADDNFQSIEMESSSLSHNENVTEEADNFPHITVTTRNLNISEQKIVNSKKSRRSVLPFFINEAIEENLETSTSDENVTIESNPSTSSEMNSTSESIMNQNSDREGEADVSNESNSLIDLPREIECRTPVVTMIPNIVEFASPEMITIHDQPSTNIILNKEINVESEAKQNNKNAKESKVKLHKGKGGKKNSSSASKIVNLNKSEMSEKQEAELNLSSNSEKEENIIVDNLVTNKEIDLVNSNITETDEHIKEGNTNDIKHDTNQKDNGVVKRKPRKRFSRGTQVSSPYFKPSKGENATQRNKAKSKETVNKITNTDLPQLLQEDETDISELANIIENNLMAENVNHQNFHLENIDNNCEPLPGPSGVNAKNISILSEDEVSSLNILPSRSEKNSINIEHEFEDLDDAEFCIQLSPKINSQITNINVRMKKKNASTSKRVTFTDETIDLTSDSPKIKEEVSSENEDKKIFYQEEKKLNTNKTYEEHGKNVEKREKKHKPAKNKNHQRSSLKSSSSESSCGHSSCSDCNADSIESSSSDCSCSSCESTSSENDYPRRRRRYRY